MDRALRSGGERTRVRGVRRVGLRRVLLVRMGELLARMHRPGLLRCPVPRVRRVLAGIRLRTRLRHQARLAEARRPGIHAARLRGIRLRASVLGTGLTRMRRRAGLRSGVSPA